MSAAIVSVWLSWNVCSCSLVLMKKMWKIRSLEEGEIYRLMCLCKLYIFRLTWLLLCGFICFFCHFYSATSLNHFLTTLADLTIFLISDTCLTLCHFFLAFTHTLTAPSRSCLLPDYDDIEISYQLSVESWPVDDIFVLPGVITSLWLDTVSARMGVGHLLLPAQLPGTHWAMICVIRCSALTVSDICLKLGCFQSTGTYSTLDVSHFIAIHVLCEFTTYFWLSYVHPIIRTVLLLVAYHLIHT